MNEQQSERLVNILNNTMELFRDKVIKNLSNSTIISPIVIDYQKSITKLVNSIYVLSWSILVASIVIGAAIQLK